MSFHVLDAPEKGTNWGSILSDGLRDLAKHKLNKTAHEHKLRYLKAGGLDPEFAHELARQPEESIQKLLSGLEGFGVRGATIQPKGYGNQQFIQQRELNKQEQAKKIELNKQEQAQNALRVKEENEIKLKRHELKNQLDIYNKMEKLINGEVLTGGTLSNFAGAVGAKALLTTPETQIFDKLASQLIGSGRTQEQIKLERQKNPHSGLSAEANLSLIQDLKRDRARELKKLIGGINQEDYEDGYEEESNDKMIPEGYKLVTESHEITNAKHVKEGTLLKLQNGRYLIAHEGQWYHYDEEQ